MITSIVSLALLAFAVSLDGFGVGITYGLRRIRIPFLSVFIIACCSGLIIWLSMQVGGWISGYLSEFAANLVGASILIAIGCWALYQLASSRQDHDAHDEQALNRTIEADGKSPIRTQHGSELGTGGNPSAAVPVIMLELKRLGLVIQILRTPQAADVDKSGNISASEAVMLGVALSLDAFGAGLGAAMLGLPALLTAMLITISSALFLVGGTQLGLRYAAKRGMNVLSFLPGVLLIMMGIMKLL